VTSPAGPPTPGASPKPRTIVPVPTPPPSH
jgi:hypothetical protein